MSKIKMYNFKKEYKTLTTNFEKQDKELFDIGILVAYESELKNGFIVKRQFKTNDKGTIFEYTECKTQEEADNYYDKVKCMYDKLNLKSIEKRLKDMLKED